MTTASMAHASTLPFAPLAFESFNSASTLTGEVSAMTIAFSNPNVSAIDGMSFTDTYPFGMLNAPGDPVLANSCGGTVAADPGGFSLSLSGASIDVQGCQLTIAVIGTAAGSLQNETGTISSTSAPPGASAIATLVVADGSVLPAPTVSKSFAPAAVPPGGTSDMTIKLTNSDPSRAIVGAHFSDVYPSGMQQPPFGVVASNTCSGDVMPFGSSLDLDGGIVPAGGECSVVVHMIGTATATNSTGPVTSDNAQTGNAASGTLTVAAGALLDAPAVSMSFTPDQVVAGDILSTSAMRITLTNDNPYDVTGVSFTDTYPMPLRMANSPSGVIASNTCGQIGTVIADPNGTSVTLTGGMIPAHDSCVIVIQVVGTAAGLTENHTGPVTSDNAYPGDDASANLTVTGGVAMPDLTLTKSHLGNFAQGQAGATYTLIAFNQGGAPTTAAVTVTDTLPPGLTASGMSGAGWSCDVQATSCTYGDPVDPGMPAPAITLTVDVAANAPSSVTNTATVAGGGETETSNDATSDPTTIDSASASADLTLTKSHSNNFSRGQSGAIFVLSAHNIGAGTSSGSVVVSDALPGAMTATNMGGAGWVCDVHATTCTRADPLAGGASYPDIMLVVSVAANSPSTLLNTANVSGGGEVNAANDGASDIVTIVATPGIATQSILFTSVAPDDATVAGQTYQALATADSQLPVVLTIDPSAATVCAVDGGGMVSFIGAGICTIDANQAGDSVYAPAPQVQQAFIVASAGGSKPQSIAFTSSAPVNAIVAGPVYMPTAHADPSGLPVVLTIQASSATVCAIDASGWVSFIGAGVCTIDANQGGDATYSAAIEVQQSFDVASAGGAISQTISFTTSAPTNATVDGSTYLAVATADSNLPVVLTIDNSSAIVCAIGNGVVSFIGAGVCTIDANQGGDATRAPAPQVQQSFMVSAASGTTTQSIHFTSTPPNPAVVAGAIYLASATADSQLPVVLTIDGSAATVCAIDHGNVSFIGAGTCTIDANQGGDVDYAPAPETQQAFAVVDAAGSAMQTISFSSAPPINATVGGATYLALATSTSHLPVVLTIDDASGAVCAINNGMVSFVGTGTCTIDANQGGDGTYAPAPEVQQQFAVNPSVAPTVLCTLATQVGIVGDSVSLDLSLLFAPPMNDSLAYGATNLPPSLSITGSLLSGTLQTSDLPSSPYTSTLKATAVLGGGSATEDVVFVVLPAGEILLRDGFDGPGSVPLCH